MTAICAKCGRDCKTQLALGKHEAICVGVNETAPYLFYDKHTDGREKCPMCKEIWADFLILDNDTWVCLACGCRFMPKARLKDVNEWKLADAGRRRAEWQDRIHRQAVELPISPALQSDDASSEDNDPTA